MAGLLGVDGRSGRALDGYRHGRAAIELKRRRRAVGERQRSVRVLRYLLERPRSGYGLAVLHAAERRQIVLVALQPRALHGDQHRGRDVPFGAARLERRDIGLV